MRGRIEETGLRVAEKSARVSPSGRAIRERASERAAAAGILLYRASSTYALTIIKPAVFPLPPARRDANKRRGRGSHWNNVGNLLSGKLTNGERLIKGYDATLLVLAPAS